MSDIQTADPPLDVDSSQIRGEQTITSEAQLKKLLKGHQARVHVFGLGDVTVPVSHDRAAALWRVAADSGIEAVLVANSVLLFRDRLYD